MFRMVIGILVVATIAIEVTKACPYFRSDEWKLVVSEMRYEDASEECRDWTERQLTADAKIKGNLVTPDAVNEMTLAAQDSFKHGVIWCCVHACRNELGITEVYAEVRDLLDVIDADGKALDGYQGNTIDETAIQCRCRRIDDALPQTTQVNVPTTVCQSEFVNKCKYGNGYDGPWYPESDGYSFSASGQLQLVVGDKLAVCEAVSATSEQIAAGQLPAQLSDNIEISENKDERVLRLSFSEPSVLWQIRTEINELADYPIGAKGVSSEGRRIEPFDLRFQENTRYVNPNPSFEAPLQALYIDNYDKYEKLTFDICVLRANILRET